MKSDPRTQDEPDFEAVLDVSSSWLYELTTSANPATVEQFIARLFREYFLEHPDQAQALLNRLAEVASDPMLRSLAYAPDDDEPLTDEDLAAIDEALDNIERGNVTPHEQLTQWSGE